MVINDVLVRYVSNPVERAASRPHRKKFILRMTNREVRSQWKQLITFLIQWHFSVNFPILFSSPSLLPTSLDSPRLFQSSLWGFLHGRPKLAILAYPWTVHPSRSCRPLLETLFANSPLTTSLCLRVGEIWQTREAKWEKRPHTWASAHPHLLLVLHSASPYPCFLACPASPLLRADRLSPRGLL